MQEQPEPYKNLAIQVKSELEKLINRRHPWEGNWQEIGEMMAPNRADFVGKKARGSSRRSRVFNSRPLQALTRFTAGLQNLLVPAQIPWFYLKTREEELMKVRNVRVWLDETTKIVRDAFVNPKMGFQSSFHEYTQDLGAFGTGVMLVLERPGSGLHFMTLPLNQCYLGKDAYDNLDTLFRKYEHSAKELVETYGEEGVPEPVLEILKNNPYEAFECIHALKPKRYFDLPQTVIGEYASVYMLPRFNWVLGIKGFHEKPFVASRWERIATETYGRGPGDQALDDVRMLNEIEKSYLRALQKVVDPPLMIPDDGFITPVRTTPGGLNYYRAGLGSDFRIMPMPTPQRIDYAKDKMADVIQSIESAFYLDMLQLPGPTAGDGDVIRQTATEVQARQQDRLPILGPIVARQESELLGPLIERTTALLLRAGLMEPPPRELMEAEYGVEYQNPVSIALRSIELQSVQQLMNYIAPFAQIDPTILRRFDLSGLVEAGAEILRTPAAILKTEEEFEAELMQEKLLQQQQMMMQQQAQAAEIAVQGTQSMENVASAEAMGRA